MTFDDYLLYKRAERRDYGHIQRKRSREMTSQIP